MAGNQGAGKSHPIDQPSRLRIALLLAVTAAAFGPYIVGGVKTDQVLVYGLVVLLLPALLSAREAQFHGSAAAIVVGWLLLIALGGVQLLVSPPGEMTQWGAGSWLANLDGFTLPLATLMVTILLARGELSMPRALRGVSAVVVIAMSVNTVIAIIASRMPVQWASIWWSAAESETSSAARAANLGRYVGLINQPAAAGVLYGIAGMCALLWLRRKPIPLALVLLTLAVGGFLAVSKAFIYIGLPVVVWHFARQRGGRAGRILVIAVVALVAWETVLATAVGKWSGAEQLERQIPTLDGAEPIAVLTGNRYGGDGWGLMEVVGPTMSREPWFGFGMAGLDTATDAAWVRALVIAGLFGVVALALSMAGMVGAYITHRGFLADDERRFFAGVLTIGLVSSFGFPTFTGNRVAVIFWLFLGLLLVAGAARTKNRHQDEPQDAAVITPPSS